MSIENSKKTVVIYYFNDRGFIIYSVVWLPGKVALGHRTQMDYHLDYVIKKKYIYI